MTATMKGCRGAGPEGDGGMDKDRGGSGVAESCEGAPVDGGGGIVDCRGAISFGNDGGE